MSLTQKALAPFEAKATDFPNRARSAVASISRTDTFQTPST